MWLLGSESKKKKKSWQDKEQEGKTCFMPWIMCTWHSLSCQCCFCFKCRRYLWASSGWKKPKNWQVFLSDSNFSYGSIWKGLLVIFTWMFIPENNNTSAGCMFPSPQWIKGLAWMENTRKGLMDRAALSSFQGFVFITFSVFLCLFVDWWHFFKSLTLWAACHFWRLPRLPVTLTTTYHNSFISMALAF